MACFEKLKGITGCREGRTGCKRGLCVECNSEKLKILLFLWWPVPPFCRFNVRVAGRTALYVPRHWAFMSLGPKRWPLWFAETILGPTIAGGHKQMAWKDVTLPFAR